MLKQIAARSKKESVADNSDDEHGDNFDFLMHETLIVLKCTVTLLPIAKSVSCDAPSWSEERNV